jgi:hypothetical protein
VEIAQYLYKEIYLVNVENKFLKVLYLVEQKFLNVRINVKEKGINI